MIFYIFYFVKDVPLVQRFFQGFIPSPKASRCNSVRVNIIFLFHGRNVFEVMGTSDYLRFSHRIITATSSQSLWGVEIAGSSEWAKSLVCALVMDTAMFQIPLASGSKVGKVFLRRQSERAGRVCRRCLPWLSSVRCWLPEDCSCPYRGPQTSLLDPAVHCKPCTRVYLYVEPHLVQLCAIPPPLFLTLPKK